MNISECKHCFSNNLKDVKNHEHLGDESEILTDDGILCLDCGCFHKFKQNKLEYFEYNVSNISKDTYKPVTSWTTDQERQRQEKELV